MTLSIEEKFNKAAKYVQGLPKDGPYQPDSDTKLSYYAYYKQGTEGDVNTARPGILDFVGKAKWDAWNSVKGTTKEEAQRKYIVLLLEALENITPRPEDIEQLIKELKE